MTASIQLTDNLEDPEYVDIKMKRNRMGVTEDPFNKRGNK